VRGLNNRDSEGVGNRDSTAEGAGKQAVRRNPDNNEEAGHNFRRAHTTSRDLRYALRRSRKDIYLPHLYSQLALEERAKEGFQTRREWLSPSLISSLVPPRGKSASPTTCRALRQFLELRLN
jgi:hypothetical protein